MKPYQAIAKAKRETEESILKISGNIQEAIDEFCERTGGRITEVTFNMADVTMVGDSQPRYIIGKVSLRIA